MLYAIVFLWQFPHFMAIAWMYREDHERAGYRMLPRARRFFFMLAQTVLPLLALLPLSVAQQEGRHVAVLYWGGLVLTLGFVYFGLGFVFQRSKEAGRRLLAASIVYRPLLLVLRVALRYQ